MSGEIIAMLAVGVALAGLIITSVRGLRLDMQARLEAISTDPISRSGARQSTRPTRASS